MKRIFNVILCLIILGAFSNIARAQDPTPPLWYFGWNETTSELFAYNADSPPTPIITIDPTIEPIGWRVAADRALAVFLVDGVIGLYDLSPTSATPITPLAGAETFLPLLQEMPAQSATHAVLTASEGIYGVGLLVDLNAQTVDLLSGEVVMPVDNWRFSQDGTMLRYWSRADRDSVEWQFWQRNLMSGDEGLLHSFSAPFPFISASTYGGQWVYRQFDESTRLMQQVAILNDGSNITLNEETLPQDNPVFTNYHLFGGDLMVYTVPCPADCTIEARPIVGGSPSVFSIPALPSAQVEFVSRPSADKLVLSVNSDYWLLYADGRNQAIGQYDSVRFEGTMEQTVSPNGDWLAVISEQDRIALWDFPRSMLALDVPSGFPILVNHNAIGTIIQTIDPPQAYRYLAGMFDGENTTLDAAFLPEDQNGIYFAVTETGALFIQSGENPERGQGIYAFDTATQSFTLIAENAYPLQLR